MKANESQRWSEMLSGTEDFELRGERKDDVPECPSRNRVSHSAPASLNDLIDLLEVGGRVLQRCGLEYGGFEGRAEEEEMWACMF